MSHFIRVRFNESRLVLCSLQGKFNLQFPRQAYHKSKISTRRVSICYEDIVKTQKPTSVIPACRTLIIDLTVNYIALLDVLLLIMYTGSSLSKAFPFVSDLRFLSFQ